MDGGKEAAGKRMGHAGEIKRGGKGKEEEKCAEIEEAGVRKVRRIGDIGKGLQGITGW